MDKYRFGEFIFNRRTSLGLTQDELGRKLGVTNKAVSKWEVGETLPDIQIISSLAEVLEVSVDELFNAKLNEKVVEEKKVTPIWKILSIIFIALSTLLTGLAIYLVIPKVETNDIEETISLNDDNFSSYILITPNYRNVIDGETLTLYGSVGLRNENLYLSSITFKITYSVQYFYYTTNDTESLISYLNKEVEIELDSNEVKSYSITLTPKSSLTNFKSFKEMNVSYKVTNVEGTIINEELYEEK